MSMWLSGANSSPIPHAAGSTPGEAPVDRDDHKGDERHARRLAGIRHGRDAEAQEDPLSRRLTRPVARLGRRSSWARLFGSTMSRMSAGAIRAGSRVAIEALRPVLAGRQAPAGRGDWLPGVVMGLSGTRRYRLFRPTGVKFGEKLPLMVMLHGCNQDARSFAACTRMNVVAARERFLVLYPVQDRLSNPNGCWNWYDTKSARAHGETASIMQAVDQVCAMYGCDRGRRRRWPFSGASMAALLAIRYPARFRAVVALDTGTAHSALSALGAMRGHRRHRRSRRYRVRRLRCNHL